MNTPKGTKPPPSKRVFLISDTHFGHENMYSKFRTVEGNPVRPFVSAQQADEAMVERWNAVVRPQDKVYHLGDVAVSKKSLSLLSRLHGDKVLIKGNHDIFKLGDYTPYFRDIRSVVILNGCALSHIPLHPVNLARFGANIHGHTHHAVVQRVAELGGLERDPNYLNICVEKTNYTPIPLDQVFNWVREQGGTVGFLEKSRVLDPSSIKSPY